MAHKAMMAEGQGHELAPDAQWVMLLPKGGTIRGRDGRTWTMDDVAEVLQRSQPGAGGPAALPVDYEHQSEGPMEGDAGPRPAAGWIEELEARDDGIYGRVAWTSKAAEMVAAREYRFLSPVFYHDKAKRILRIVGAGLTHRPNLELRALASEGEPAEAEDLASIRKAAGLGKDATVEDVLAFCRQAATPATPDPARFLPMEAVAELMRDRRDLRAEARDTDAERRVDDAVMAGHITPAMRGWAIALCHQDVASFDAFLGSSPAPFAHIDARTATRSHGVADRRHSGDGAPSTEEERAICKMLGIERIAH